MISNIAVPNIELSNSLDGKLFSVGDPGLILDILRSKLYSNPILAVCREYSCNARDTHREVGASNRPIEITLPSHLNPFYKIKDFGLGISPDRIENIFIKYGASTKRYSNEFVGFFGIGSKVAMAVSDNFTVKTIYNGIEYHYSIFIDETRVGKLVLLNQYDTGEPNGTEIIIPVKPADFRAFIDCTEQATRHWDVKPIIKGVSGFSYITYKYVVEGSNWKIVECADRYAEKSVKLIIDGIEYPLDLTALNKYADLKLINSLNGTLVLYFNTGDISLSASREQVYLDKNTQETIKKSLNKVTAELKTQITNKLNDLPNLYQAYIYRNSLAKSFYSLDVFGILQWRNINLNKHNYISTSCTVYQFKKGKYNHKRGTTDQNKIVRRTIQEVNFEENTKLLINDLNIVELTAKFIKPCFDKDDTLKSVIVVCPNKTTTLDVLNKNCHLDQMAPELLSSYTTSKERKYTGPTSRLIVFKYDYSSFSVTSYSDIKEDSNKKIICRLTARKENYNNAPRRIVLKNGNTLPTSALMDLMKNSNYSIYGVDESISDARIKKDFAGFIDIEDFIAQQLNNSTVDFIKVAASILYEYEVKQRIGSSFEEFKSQIIDQNSIYMKYISIHYHMNEVLKNDRDLLFLYELMKNKISETEICDWLTKNPDWDIIKINADYAEKYPLLTRVSCYYDAETIQYISQYVNLIDKI